jgi:hypothetical protein
MFLRKKVNQFYKGQGFTESVGRSHPTASPPDFLAFSYETASLPKIADLLRPSDSATP